MSDEMSQCRRHLSDYSSSIGVCASCLRDRLVSLLHSRTQPSPDLNPNLISEPDSPPFVFPSNSIPLPLPKISPFHPLYNTPQLGPTFTRRLKRQSSGKSGFVSKLLRSMRMTGKPDSGFDYSDPMMTSFSHYYCTNEGISPESRRRESSSSGRVQAERVWRSASAPLSGLALLGMGRCRRISGEIRVSDAGNGKSSSSKERPPVSDAASFWGSRSRKVADFGRVSGSR